MLKYTVPFKMLGPVNFLFFLFLKIIYAFIQQGFIKWIKSNSENIYIVTKDFYLKQMLFIWAFYLTKNIKYVSWFPLY